MRPRGANRAPFPRGALTGTDLDRFYIDNLSQSGRLRARVEVRSCRSRGSRPFAPVVPPRSTSRGVLELRKAKASTRPFPFAEPSAVGTFNSVRPRVRSLPCWDPPRRPVLEGRTLRSPGPALRWLTELSRMMLG